MKTIKQTQKAKINQLVKKFNKAQQNGIRDIFQAYEKPSFEKECIYHNLVNLAIKMNSFDYGCISGNNQLFTFMIVYYDNGNKRIRYFTRYNTYDCEMI